MKLIKTIRKIIEEAEYQLNLASETRTPVDELDRLEKNYKNSLKLLEMYKANEKTKKKGRSN